MSNVIGVYFADDNPARVSEDDYMKMSEILGNMRWTGTVDGFAIEKVHCEASLPLRFKSGNHSRTNVVDRWQAKVGLTIPVDRCDLCELGVRDAFKNNADKPKFIYAEGWTEFKFGRTKAEMRANPGVWWDRDAKIPQVRHALTDALGIDDIREASISSAIGKVISNVTLDVPSWFVCVEKNGCAFTIKDLNRVERTDEERMI